MKPLIDSEALLPRVLFISVNPFSTTTNNGKTFASFFEGYPPGCLAQLYFHRELPNSPVCNNYYRITDEDIFRSRGRLWKVTGGPITPDSTSDTVMPEQAHKALKASTTARLLRQILWSCLRLHNRTMSKWIEDFGPDIIVFCGGDAVSLYPKVTSLARRHGCGLVLYVTDDYVLPTQATGLAAAVARRWNRHVFTRMAQRANLVLTIGQAMSDIYAQEFGVESVPVMNIVPIPDAVPTQRPKASSEPLILLYAGSLHSNRWRVLSQLIESCERLSEKGVDVTLRVVGPLPSRVEAAAIQRPPHGRHDGLLEPELLSAAISEAHVLVHVEAEDSASMTTTALSVSTKIPEYLASGRPILAVGPTGLASIDYLAEHQAAIVVSPRDGRRLDAAIESLSMDPDYRRMVARRGFRLAQQNHDPVRTRRSLWAHLRRITT